MTIKDKNRAKNAIQEVARCKGVSSTDIRQAMQECIDESWNNKDQTSAAEAWSQYFPDGKKPSVEDFIIRLVKEIEKEENL